MSFAIRMYVLCILLMALVMERVNRNKHTKSKTSSNAVKTDRIADNTVQKLSILTVEFDFNID